MDGCMHDEDQAQENSQKKRKLLNESMKLKKRNDEFVFAAQLKEIKWNETKWNGQSVKIIVAL